MFGNPGQPDSATAVAGRRRRLARFVSLYEPFVLRFARRSGLQDADARELVQDVLVSVVQAVGRWQVDPERARFRTWLFRIARNRLLDVLAQRERQKIRAGSSGLVDFSHADGLVEQGRRAHQESCSAGPPAE